MELEVLVYMEDQQAVVTPARWDNTVDELLEACLEIVGRPQRDADGLLLAHCGPLPPGAGPQAKWLATLLPMTKLRAVLRTGEPVKVLQAAEAPRFSPSVAEFVRVRRLPPGPAARGRMASQLARRTELACGLLLLQAELGAPPGVLAAFASDASVAFAPLLGGESPKDIARRLYGLAYTDAKITAGCRADPQPARPFLGYQLAAPCPEDENSVCHEVSSTMQNAAPRQSRAAVVRCGLCATVRRPGASALASFVCFHLAAGFHRLYLFFEEGEQDPDLVALRRDMSAVLDDGRVVIIPYGAQLDQERRNVCEYWWSRHAPHQKSEIQARQVLNTLVALRRAHADNLHWLLHIDSDEAFVCDRPVGEHFGMLSSSGTVDQVHYLSREAFLEKASVEDPFREVTLFKKNPLEGGPPFYAHKEGKSAVCVATTLGQGARPAGSLSFAGFAPGRSRTFDPDFVHVLHYPYSNCAQFAQKYAWRREEQWNNHAFHLRCLEAARADATAPRRAELATDQLFREVLGTETEREDLVKRGLCIRDAIVQDSLCRLPGQQRQHGT